MITNDLSNTQCSRDKYEMEKSSSESSNKNNNEGENYSSKVSSSVHNLGNTHGLSDFSIDDEKNL